MTEKVSDAAGNSETSANNTTQAHEYGRPASIEDASNTYFIHPLSNYVVKISIALGLTPNFISLLGLGCGLLAGYFYFQPSYTSYALAAFAAMIGWHILDGADGKLARATGQTSAFGRIIDGICDHLVFAAVYIALALYMINTGYSLTVWCIVVGAGVSHAVQSAGYEERRQRYQRRLDDIQREAVEDSLLVIEGKRSFWAGFYDKAQKFVSGGDYGLDAEIVRMRTVPGEAANVIPLINKTAPMVKTWGLLNANNRTALIFICAFFGQPILYFVIEITFFNLLLIALMIAERHQEKALVASLRNHDAS